MDAVSKNCVEAHVFSGNVLPPYATGSTSKASNAALAIDETRLTWDDTISRTR